MEQEKLLKWCKENFNFDTQKWEYEYIPNEILDCIISIMKNGGPNCENEGDDDFIDDFIFDNIVYGKQGEITRMRLKRRFDDETKHLFD